MRESLGRYDAYLDRNEKMKFGARAMQKGDSVCGGSPHSLIPAQAGIQSRRRRHVSPWVPASAGTSGLWRRRQKFPWMARIKQGMARQTNAVIRSRRNTIC